MIVNADGGLFSPDFRGQEQMAQVIVQVAGARRAGPRPAGRSARSDPPRRSSDFAENCRFDLFRLRPAYSRRTARGRHAAFFPFVPGSRRSRRPRSGAFVSAPGAAKRRSPRPRTADSVHRTFAGADGKTPIAIPRAAAVALRQPSRPAWRARPSRRATRGIGRPKGFALAYRRGSHRNALNSGPDGSRAECLGIL